MKQRLQFFSFYTLLLYLFFVVSRLSFLVYHIGSASKHGLVDALLTFWNGASLDVSFVCYLLLFPLLVLIVTSFTSYRPIKIIFSIYTAIILVILSFIQVVDLELYSYWGFRMDNTPLDYLQTPGEAFVSVSKWLIVRQLFLGVLLFSAFWYLYQKGAKRLLTNSNRGGWKTALLFFILIAPTIIIMRGGRVTGLPIAVGDVYFHKDPFMNHAAINLPWNIASSFYESSYKDAQMVFFEQEKADSLTQQTFKKYDNELPILKTKRPNVVLVLLESFSARAVAELGGSKEASPQFSKLIKEGVFFDNFYATGVRSNKAIVGVLSAFPSQRGASVIFFPKKVSKLPFISKTLQQQGYATSFYYGGNMNFANFNVYFHNAGFDKIIYDKDFDRSQFSVWGAPDHIVFDRMFNELQSEKEPFFSMIFTLSSHRPYDVPMKAVIEGKDTESMYNNSIYYTDKSLGDFISRAKKTDWWDNTLIVVLADHGVIINNKPLSISPDFFHIPMLWLGGALAVQDTVVSTIGSQTDIAATLLQQMNVPSSDFVFSKNILSPKSNSLAYYVHYSGFGLINDSTSLSYSTTSNNTSFLAGKPDTTLVEVGKATMQQTSKFVNEEDLISIKKKDK